MSELQIAVLALVQGITEFLPISSSGHLILVPVVFGWPDQGLLVDIAVHVGSLGAVLLYFRQDVSLILKGALPGVARQDAVSGRRLFLLITIGTIPVVVAGLALKLAGGDGLRSAAVIGWATLIFGILLFIADHYGPRRREVQDMSLGAALVIGLFQTLALIPGTSRSGITITAARLLGFRRDEAARFSLLLSIPAILAAGGLLTLDLIKLGETGLGLTTLLAAVLAFISALAAIALMMRWLQRSSFTPFVVYRCLLGAALLFYAYGG